MAFIGKHPGKAAITSTDITDGIITAAKLASDSVTTAKIADNGVTTAKINADAVTDAKIADDVVGTEHLTAGEVDTTALGADAVTAAKIADNAISEEHLDATVVTGLTALAAEPADTDEFLISDAGTLKKIDYSYIKGGGITVANQWRYTGGASFTGGNELNITSDIEEVTTTDTAGQGKIGTSMSESSGVFTFPSTGVYLVGHTTNAYSTGDYRYIITKINVTTDNSNYTTVAANYASQKNVTSATYSTAYAHTLIDVTNTSNVKVKFSILAADDGVLQGGTAENRTYFTFIRLGDT